MQLMRTYSYFVFALILPGFLCFNVSELCYEECGSRMVSAEDNFDVACNDTCTIQKCYDGCDSWQNAITTSCQEACEEEKMTLNKNWDLYCVMGCNSAISIYILKIKEEIGTPPPPYLVAESCTNDSLTIAWQPILDVPCLVQLRYEHQENDWEYYEPTEMLKTNQLTLANLHPYTNYRFRIAWILVRNTPPLFSEESITISTFPYGIPATSPASLSVTIIGPTCASVSWENTIFPNGPILSYVIYIREYPSGTVAIKDVSDTSGGFYMFHDLKPATTYTLSVATRNIVGEGPVISQKFTTPIRDVFSSSLDSRPYLVFAAKDSILEQGVSILDESKVLYASPNDSALITGVSLHVKKELLFFSTSEGFVYRQKTVPKSPFIDVEVIIKADSNSSALSIDWLNEWLYIVEENKIVRCSFKGSYYEILLTDLLSEPTCIHVDPYNGYLFWAMDDPEIGGIYRMDLAEFHSGAKTLKDAQSVLQNSDILAFAVDYKNFRLFIPCKNNTIISTALDGNDSKDIRQNSQTSQFSDVTSLAVYQGLFYWTNSIDMFAEEYHKPENMFYHNAYLLTNGPFSNINIQHQDCQPEPVPLNPVESVQAVFSDKKVKIRWSKPRTLGGLGKGSWQKWQYEVHIVGEGISTAFIGNITKHLHTLEDLQPNASYVLKVRAYSSSGHGPWSSVFNGHTLKRTHNRKNLYVLWSSREGLIKSDIIGDNIQHLISNIYLNNGHIKGISWYKDKIFLNTNSSLVYSYNMNSNHSLSRLTNVSNAASIAVDWLAPKLYWSSPVQQMISRANLDGTRSEPLPILTVAKQLAIDSPSGHIYWATSHSIECSRLNGDGHFLYMKNELFSGKHVMGLTLDFDKRKVYWIVRSYEGSLMYRSSLAGEVQLDADVQFEFMGQLPEDDIRGPLAYFNEKLFYIHEHKGALLSDVNGHNIASIQGPGLSGLKAISIVNPELQPYPDGFDETSINVVPTSVVDLSIQVQGIWNDFNITWDPVESINYGTLFYEVKVDDGEEIFTIVTENEPVISYPNVRALKPYRLLTIAVKSYTFWASSRQTIVFRHSPMSTPTKPLEPRIFIAYKTSHLYRNQDIQAIFRWLPPSSPNGLITGYEVVWMNENGEKNSSYLNGSDLQFVLNSLNRNTTYKFQVRAFTEIGDGPFCDSVQAKTSEEYPVPQLIFTKADAVKITDVDTQEQKLLSRKVTRPISVAYLAHENRIFWIEEDGALMSSSLDGTNETLVKHLTSKVTSISIDWVARELFWTEVDHDEKYSSIWSVDLNKGPTAQMILNHSGVITSLETEPFSSSLIWIVKQQKSDCQLMISNNKDINPRFFFSKSSPSSKIRRTKFANNMCNCLPSYPVGKTFTIDNTNIHYPKVIYVDGVFGHIWSSDINGCRCHLLLNSSDTSNLGLPPSSLTVDGSRLYWTNETLGKLFSINKGAVNDIKSEEIRRLYTSKSEDSELDAFQVTPLTVHKKSSIYAEEIHGIKTIRAIGNNLQPFPEPSCLSPLPYGEEAQLTEKSSISLTLYLPPAKRPHHCRNMSMAVVKYVVHYKKVDSINYYTTVWNNTMSKIVETYENVLVLADLQPYSNYMIQIGVINYYTAKFFLGPIVVHQTSEGTPSAPTNVSAKVVSPFHIDVFWQPPLFPNSHHVSYEVHWKTENNLKSSKSEKYVQHFDKHEESFVMTIYTDQPGALHHISVHVYSELKNLHNSSSEIMIQAYDAPNNLTLMGMESHALNLLWLSPKDNSVTHHKLEYSKVDSLVWHAVTKTVPTEPRNLYEFRVTDLDSKSTFNFRLLLMYSKGVVIEWPMEYYFQFGTVGDVPCKPGEPQIRFIDNDKYEIHWDKAIDNDGEELLYNLQIKILDEVFSDWSNVSTTATTKWTVQNVSLDTNYAFRVRAFNEYGASNFSFSNSSFIIPEAKPIVHSNGDQTSIFMASGVASLILLTLGASVVFMIYRRREKDKKILHDCIAQTQLSSELELATLQELPRHGNFIHQTNVLYNLGDLPTDEELLSLPQVQRDQIILTKFLGSGAFGEVFEGIAQDLVEGLPPMKVAIKTLRKGATDHEKEEFLKEAKLMSNFKHDHILQLLGVCFNNNPNFIILELMEGGDLLSYLRSNRPSMIQRSSLTLDDLLGICVDVSEGCKYLEDMHFVHRDLAARNCLVSSFDREHRIVKIGDFGLARDIYKHDYYRKEGEGLLPVRWMAPESLVYGIFTSYSDVWAFGVLLWEVMTLGQQPYPARTNIEVLHYVRAAGRLDKPEFCPDELHQIMCQCWCYNPEGRPTFNYCLNALQELRQNTRFSPTFLISVQNQNYLNDSVSGAYIVANNDSENRKHEAEESTVDDDHTFDTPNDLASSSLQVMQRPKEVKRSASFTHRAEHSVTTANMLSLLKNTAHGGNKYLELLGETEDAHGYEIPRRIQDVVHRKSSYPSDHISALQSQQDPDPEDEAPIFTPFLVPSYSQVFSCSSKDNNFVSDNSDISYIDDNVKITNTSYFDNLNQNTARNKECSEKHNSCAYHSCCDAISASNLSDKDLLNDDNSCEKCSETDDWSIKTASTLPCDCLFASNSLRNSQTCLTNAIDDINVNYVLNTSWC